MVEKEEDLVENSIYDDELYTKQTEHNILLLFRIKFLAIEASSESLITNRTEPKWRKKGVRWKCSLE